MIDRIHSRRITLQPSKWPIAVVNAVKITLVIHHHMLTREQSEPLRHKHGSNSPLIYWLPRLQQSACMYHATPRPTKSVEDCRYLVQTLLNMVSTDGKQCHIPWRNDLRLLLGLHQAGGACDTRPSWHIHSLRLVDERSDSPDRDSANHWRKLPHVVAERVKMLTPGISLAAQRGNEKDRTIKSVNWIPSKLLFTGLWYKQAEG